VLHELDILGDDPDFIKTLLSNFESEGLRHIEYLNQAIQDDYLEYREQLHALKGSATELGAGKLVQTCQEAEELKPYDMASEKIKQMCVRVEKVFKSTVAALNNAATVNQDIYQSKTTD
jgi:two-component system sensor histidine kinase RpfC